MYRIFQYKNCNIISDTAEMLIKSSLLITTEMLIKSSLLITTILNDKARLREGLRCPEAT
jgi:hypothetical protein